MMTDRPIALALLFALLAGTTGCKRRSDAASAPPSETKLTSAAPGASSTMSPAVVPFVPKHQVPPFKGALPHRPEPLASANARVVRIALVRKSGESDVAPLFALTNLTSERVFVGQTWVYYYDRERKQLDAYPHSLGQSFELAPGETKETRLGWTSDKLPKDTSTIEAEVSSARVGDRAWMNENLVDQSHRPVGGLDAQALEDRAGERVIVDVYALRSKRVRLTNVSDHPVKGVDLHYFYVDAKNALHSAWAPSQKLAADLAPGESIDFTPKMLDAKENASPAGARRVVAFANEVDFSDGTPSFQNKNLAETVRWQGLATK